MISSNHSFTQVMRVILWSQATGGIAFDRDCNYVVLLTVHRAKADLIAQNGLETSLRALIHKELYIT